MQTTFAQAVGLCCQVEEVIAPLGWHVALTGGCLFKDGPRKDADILCYPHDVDKVKANHDSEKVVRALEAAGLFIRSYNEPASTTDKEVWVGKSPEGFRIDLFFLRQ